MIAANVTFRFSPTSGFAQAVRRYSPTSANVIQSPSGTAQFVDIPMVGTAPASSIYALKVFPCRRPFCAGDGAFTSERPPARKYLRSEEHTSELQSPPHLVCRPLLEKKKRDSQKNHKKEQRSSLDRY